MPARQPTRRKKPTREQVYGFASRSGARNVINWICDMAIQNVENGGGNCPDPEHRLIPEIESNRSALLRLARLVPR